MPEYPYFCPECGDFDVTYSMEDQIPHTARCPRCKGLFGLRVFLPVAVQYHSPGFTRSLPDRPDERLDREIKRSMDFDATGQSWEQRDRELEQTRARHGEALRKDVVLP